jgi:type I restriction enzyme M protein
MCVFADWDDKRLRFRENIASLADIRSILENQPGLAATRRRLDSLLAKWWETARDDFSSLAPGKTNNAHKPPRPVAHATSGNGRLPKVRAALLNQLVERLVPVGVLDRFQIRGVFVNWWDGTDEKSIKYDLKTITSIGWAPTLIPEAMVVDRFFSTERDTVAALEQQIAEDEVAIEEAVENARAAVEYEPDEDEKITAQLMRKQLADEIADDPAGENRVLRQAAEALAQAEATLKEHRSERDRLNSELKLKVELKLYGPQDRIQETQDVLNQAEGELAAAGGPPPNVPRSGRRGEPKPRAEEKETLKRRKRLAADVATLAARIATTYQLMEQIGGPITEEEGRQLILQKHHDLVAGHLKRYVRTEERVLFSIFENLFAKYATSAQTIEIDRHTILDQLQDYLNKVGYV